MNEKDSLYVIWTEHNHFIAKIVGYTDDFVTLGMVYKLILSSMIPVPVSEVLVIKREDIFVLCKIGDE